MTVVDTLVLGVLVIGLILGLLRGFLSQVTGIVGLLAGCYLAWRYHDPVRAAIIDPLFSTTHNGKIAFGVIVLVALLLAALFGWLIGLFFDKMNMGAYDRLMGGVFGIVKSGLICAGILLAIVSLANDNGRIERAIGSSKSGPVLWDAMDRVAGVLPERVRTDVREFLRTNHPAPPRREGERDRPNK